MCHASWREQQRHKSFQSIHEPDREEHHGHQERGEGGEPFMPRHGHHQDEGDRFEARSGLASDDRYDSLPTSSI